MILPEEAQAAAEEQAAMDRELLEGLKKRGANVQSLQLWLPNRAQRRAMRRRPNRTRVVRHSLLNQARKKLAFR